MLGGLAAAGLALSTVQYVDARRTERDAIADTADARAEAARAADELVDLRADLIDTDRSLVDAEAGLAVAVAALEQRLGARDALTVEVAALRAQLEQLHGAISGTQSEAEATAGLAATLASCLDGVTELLNQVSVGDDFGAATTAQRIGPACAAVGTVLG